MKQRNWICDTSMAREELGFVPDYTLDRGVAETVAWYKKDMALIPNFVHDVETEIFDVIVISVPS